jgi:hypothetical protein
VETAKDEEEEVVLLAMELRPMEEAYFSTLRRPNKCQKRPTVVSKETY